VHEFKEPDLAKGDRELTFVDDRQKSRVFRICTDLEQGKVCFFQALIAIPNQNTSSKASSGASNGGTSMVQQNSVSKALATLRAPPKPVLHVRVLAAENLANADENTANIEDVSDPFVEVLPRTKNGELYSGAGATGPTKKTHTEWDTLNPVWDEQFDFLLPEDFATSAPFGLELLVKDDEEDEGALLDPDGSDCRDLEHEELRHEELRHDNLGKLSIAPAKLAELAQYPFSARKSGKQICGWFPLGLAPGMSEAQGALHLQAFVAPEGYAPTNVLCMCSSCAGDRHKLHRSRSDSTGRTARAIDTRQTSQTSYFDGADEDSIGEDETEETEDDSDGANSTGRAAANGNVRSSRRQRMIEQAVAGDKVLGEQVRRKLEKIEKTILHKHKLENSFRVGGGHHTGKTGVVDYAHGLKHGFDSTRLAGQGKVEVRLDEAPHEPIDIDTLHLTEQSTRCVLYENQRWMPMHRSGWTNRLLPTDRGQWTDRSGKEGVSFRIDRLVITPESIGADGARGQEENEMSAFVRNLFQLLKPPLGFEWSGRWHVDNKLGECDDRGWTHAFDFVTNQPVYTNGRARAGYKDCVRQRRWVRYVVPLEGAGGSGGGGSFGKYGLATKLHQADAETEIQRQFARTKEQVVVTGSDAVVMQGTLYWQRRLMRVKMIAGPFANQKGQLRDATRLWDANSPGLEEFARGGKASSSIRGRRSTKAAYGGSKMVGSRADYKVQLVAFYRKYDAGARVNVDEVLDTYQGKELVLFAQLREKYEKVHYVRVDGQRDFIEARGTDFECVDWDPCKVHAELKLALRDDRVEATFRAFDEETAVPVEELTITGGTARLMARATDRSKSSKGAITVKYGIGSGDAFEIDAEAARPEADVAADAAADVAANAAVNALTMQSWWMFFTEAAEYTDAQDARVHQVEEGFKNAKERDQAYQKKKLASSMEPNSMRARLTRFGRDYLHVTGRHELPRAVKERLEREESRSNELLPLEETDEEREARVRHSGNDGNASGAASGAAEAELGLSRKQLAQIEKAEPGDYQVEVHIIEARNLPGTDWQGTSDPIAYVQVGESKRLHTRAQRASSSCVFDEMLYFQLENCDSASLERSQITIKLCNHHRFGMLGEGLLGEFVIDLASAYIYQPKRQWAVLVNAREGRAWGGSDHSGGRGFLQLSITVRGPGDSRGSPFAAVAESAAKREGTFVGDEAPIAGAAHESQHAAHESQQAGVPETKKARSFWKGWRHSAAAESTGPKTKRRSRSGGGSNDSGDSHHAAAAIAPGLAKIMIPSQVERELWFLRVGVHRAEELPNMDWVFGTNKGIGIDPYVRIKFAGNRPVKTKVLKSNSPMFKEEFWIPVLLPMCGQKIEIEVWDHDTASPDELVATVLASFDDIRNGQRGWASQQIGDQQSFGTAVKGAHAHPCPSPRGCTGGTHWYNLYGAQAVNIPTVGFGRDDGLKSETHKMNTGALLGSTYRGRLLLSMHAVKNTSALKLKQQLYTRKHRPYPRLADNKLYLMRAHLIMATLLPFSPAQKVSVEVHFGKFVMTSGEFAVEDGEQIRTKLAMRVVGQRWGQEMRFPKIETGEVPNAIVCLCVKGKSVAFCHIPAPTLFDAQFEYLPQWYPLQRDPSCPPQLSSPRLPLSDEIYAGSLLLALGLGYALDSSTGRSHGSPVAPADLGAAAEAEIAPSLVATSFPTSFPYSTQSTEDILAEDASSAAVQQPTNERRLSWQALSDSEKEAWERVHEYPTQRWELRVHVYQV
jgi:hypothetical protein